MKPDVTALSSQVRRIPFAMALLKKVSYTAFEQTEGRYSPEMDYAGTRYKRYAMFKAPTFRITSLLCRLLVLLTVCLPVHAVQIELLVRSGDGDPVSGKICLPDSLSIVWKEQVQVIGPVLELISDDWAPIRINDITFNTNPHSIVWSARQSIAELIGSANYRGDSTFRFRVIFDRIQSDTGLSAEFVFSSRTQPEIVTQPQSRQICPEGVAALLVEALPADSIDTIEWFAVESSGPVREQVGSGNVLRVDSRMLTLFGGRYAARVSGPCMYTIYSDTAEVSIAPQLVVEPRTPQLSACEGDSITLAVDVQSATGRRIQWFHANNLIPNAVGTEYTITSVRKREHEGQYTVLVSDTCSDDVTVQLNLNIIPPPVLERDINEDFGALTLHREAGQSLRLAVQAAGPNLQYRWYKDNRLLPGQSGPALEFGALQPADAGSYWVEISNDCGDTLSKQLRLTVDSGNLLDGVQLSKTNGELKAGIGDTLNLTILIEGVSRAELLAAGYETLLVDVNIGIAGVVFPALPADQGGTIEGGSYFLTLERPLAGLDTGATGEALLNLGLIALLGEAPYSPLRLGNPRMRTAGGSIEALPDAAEIRDTVRITDIWYDANGKPRLLNTQRGAMHMRLSPNPAGEEFTVSAAGYTGSAALNIYNTRGIRLIGGLSLPPGGELTVANPNYTLLAPGQYFCRLTSGKNSVVRVLIVE